jgi:hypothetical protein
MPIQLLELEPHQKQGCILVYFFKNLPREGEISAYAIWGKKYKK